MTVDLHLALSIVFGSVQDDVRDHDDVVSSFNYEYHIQNTQSEDTGHLLDFIECLDLEFNGTLIVNLVYIGLMEMGCCFWIRVEHK